MKEINILLKKLCTGVCLILFLTSMLNAQTTIIGSTDDQAVLSNGGAGWVGAPAHRIGGAGSGYDGGSVHPFELPSINPGDVIISASYNMEYTNLANTPTGNIDLYGLPYRTTSAVSTSTDYWQGSFGNDPNATAIQDNFLTISTSIGIVATNATGNDNLVDYINAQYAAGAQGGDYIFLRVNPDVSDEPDYRYWEIATANSSNKPTLELVIGTSADTQAPSVPTGLASSTITINSVALSWNASTDNVGVTGYKVYTNGSNPQSVTGTSTTISGLNEATSYTFTVSAIDAASNESAQSSALNATTLDGTAPSVPTGLTSGTVTTSSVALSWNASTDNVGVTGYKVYTDGANPVTIAGTSTTISGLSASTQYSFTVSAIDAASNESAQSSALQVTTATPADTQAPSVPTGLTSGTITTNSVALSWNASTDNVGVTGYKVYTDGTNPVTVAGTSTTISGLSASTQYSFTISAIDAASNESAQSSTLNVTTSSSSFSNLALNKPVTVDSEYNTTYVAEKAVDGNNVDNANRWLSTNSAYPHWIEIDLEETSSIEQVNFWIGYNGYNRPIYDYQIQYWTGSAWADIVNITGNNNAIVTHNFSTVETDKVRLYCTDGEDDIVRLYEIEVWGSAGSSGGGDTEAPSVPTGLAAGTVTSTSVDLSWTASTDNVGVTGYKVYTNGSNPVNVTGTSTTITGLASSTQYSFTVSAIDAASNESAQSSAIQVTTATPPDTQAPSVPTGLAAGTITSSSVALSWNASTDNVGVTGYKVYTNGANPVTVGGTNTTINGLASSTQYSFTVSAIDAASNESAQSSAVNATTSSASGVTSSAAWQSFTVSTETGVFTATFDATPNGSALDAITGILNGSASAYGDIACIIRFNTSGQIDARNGGSYAADNVVNYTSGISYHFRVEISVPTHTYSVYVTPQGSSEQTVASNFAFRSEQASVSQLTGWTLYAASGSHTVSNMMFTQAAPDTEAPSVPTGLASSGIFMTGFTLSWNPSSDNVGVTVYEVFKDGASYGTTSNTSMVVTGLSSSTTYSMTVRAGDAVPNWSAQSSAINVTTSADAGGDWPSPSNTGYSGTLTSHSGDITTTSNGQLIENLNISGSIHVVHSNVTIRNCKFTNLDIAQNAPYTGCVVEDCELVWAGRQNFTLRRCKMTNHSTDLIRTGGHNVTVEDCYLVITGPMIDGAHADIIQEYPTYSGSNMLARHNTMYNECPATSCINVRQGWTIENNLIAGGSFPLYVYDAVITDNHFSTIFFPTVGNWGVYYGDAPGSTCSGNVYHETGVPVNCSGTSSAEFALNAKEEQQSVKLYPNPLNSSTLNIELRGYDVYESINVNILDLTGRSVYNKSHAVEQSELKLQLDNLKKGIYIVNINGNEVSTQEKLVVE